jgi:hypothetical protein
VESVFELCSDGVRDVERHGLGNSASQSQDAAPLIAIKTSRYVPKNDTYRTQDRSASERSPLDGLTSSAQEVSSESGIHDEELNRGRFGDAVVIGMPAVSCLEDHASDGEGNMSTYLLDRCDCIHIG